MAETRLPEYWTMPDGYRIRMHSARSSGDHRFWFFLSYSSDKNPAVEVHLDLRHLGPALKPVRMEFDVAIDSVAVLMATENTEDNLVRFPIGAIAHELEQDLQIQGIAAVCCKFLGAIHHDIVPFVLIPANSPPHG